MLCLLFYHRSVVRNILLVLVGSDVYVFSFQKTIAASEANLRDHFFYPDRIALNNFQKPDCEVKDGYAKYIVPKTFVSISDAIELAIAQVQRSESVVHDMVESGSGAVVSAIVTNLESLLPSGDDSDHDTSFETDDEPLVSVDNPPENMLNMHLVTWMRKNYIDNFVKLRAINV